MTTLPPDPVVDLAHDARRFSGAAIEELSRLMLNGESEAVRVAAAREILDRGHGKP